MGGRGAFDYNNVGGLKSAAASGGASCQSYNNISLTAGETINVTCYPYTSSSNPRATSFGSYSVAAGGNASISIDSSYNLTPIGGTASGNLGVAGGTNSATGLNASSANAYGTGKYSSQYGYGYGASNGSSGYSSGAVYIKYLGA